MSIYEVHLDPRANVHHTVQLGNGVTIWAWATVMEGAVLGEACVIATQVEIGRRAQLGRECRIQHGTAICDEAILGERVFVGSNVSIADCAHPNLRDKSAEVHVPPVIGDDVVIGCNAVINPGVTIGNGVTIGSGAVVTKSVSPGLTVVGNPARPLLKRRGQYLGMTQRILGA